MRFTEQNTGGMKLCTGFIIVKFYDVYEVLNRQGRRNVFSFGGGGGGKGKKGHNNVKKGTNGAHADNIANVLMKHHCRQRFFLHAESFFFFFFFLLGGTE